jgi:hypothetical protein
MEKHNLSPRKNHDNEIKLIHKDGAADIWSPTTQQPAPPSAPPALPEVPGAKKGKAGNGMRMFKKKASKDPDTFQPGKRKQASGFNEYGSRYSSSTADYDKRKAEGKLTKAEIKRNETLSGMLRGGTIFGNLGEEDGNEEPKRKRAKKLGR